MESINNNAKTKTNKERSLYSQNQRCRFNKIGGQN